MRHDHALEAAAGALARFIQDEPLTAKIADIEHELNGCGRGEVGPIISARGVSPDLLRGALLVRSRLGRINDLINAAAISLALPELLEPNEVLRRPSLAAGNDPSRPYDVETDRRVAEFKLARWDGHDAMRKRQVFKDLVHLAAADTSGRRAELYVLGPAHDLPTARVRHPTYRRLLNGRSRAGSAIPPVASAGVSPRGHVLARMSISKLV